MFFDHTPINNLTDSSDGTDTFRRLKQSVVEQLDFVSKVEAMTEPVNPETTDGRLQSVVFAPFDPATELLRFQFHQFLQRKDPPKI